MSEEEWRVVPGYEGYYEVSSYGGVRGLERLLEQRSRLGNVFLRRRKARQHRPTITQPGYYSVTLCKDGKQTPIGVHRLVALVFIPNPENKPFVNHLDGNPLNNHVSNLEWCTPKENVHHAVSIGLVNNKGVNNPAAVAEEHTVAFAKALAQLNLFSDRVIGEYLGKSREFVKDIRLGRNWTSVPATQLRIVSITSPNQ